MAKIKFGPGGLGSIKDAIVNLYEYHRLGINACEVEFVYRVYINKEQAIEIGKTAKNLGIGLSVHCPYYINLNSADFEKIEASKKRILNCCEIGHYLGAKKIVFHSGFYGNRDYEETYANIHNAIVEIKKGIEKNKWDVELCPEIMGKANVFGSIEDIQRLVVETGCSFCIDFAHILARYGENKFNEVAKAFPQESWHCHFSGIVYGEKGEKNHIKTSEKEWEELLNFLKTLDKDVVIINESPTPVEDSVMGKKVFGELD
ncbi:MAG: TIM barrel protein [Candidatus Pacearchaeota archaeon]